MDTMRIYQQCGKPLPQDAPEGLCPTCLAKVVLGTETAAPSPTINVHPLAEAPPHKAADLHKPVSKGVLTRTVAERPNRNPPA